MNRRFAFIFCLAFSFPCFAENPPLQPGEMAPLFTMKDASGETVRLKDLRGRITVIEWTNTECPAVQKHYNTGNIPTLQSELAAKNVAWITVFSTGKGQKGYLTADAIRNNAMQNGSRALLIPDTDARLAKLYRITTVPQLFVLDADGIIAYAGAIDSKPGIARGEIDQATNYVRVAVEATEKNEPLDVPSSKPYGCPLKMEPVAQPRR